MKNSRGKKRLLVDILAEESDPGLRDALFGQSLRLVRRQRRFRAVRGASSLLAIIMLSSVLVFQVVRPRTSSIKPRAPRYESGYTLIRTQSATPAMIVTTEPFPSSEVVASVPVEQIVTTRDSRPSFVELTDDQLLDLARGAPVALVRQGPHEAELVFVNEGDREKLFHD